MDNTSFPTSFIPRKPIMESKSSVRRPIPIFSFLGSFILIVAIGASIGLYIYKNTLNNQIKGLQSSLAIAKKSFEPETISNLQLFDKRMSVSREVFSSHIVLSPLFNLLSSITIPSVQYTDFEESYDKKSKTFKVSITGVARDYKSIALQSQVFNSDKGKYLKDVLFSDLVLSSDKDTKGYINFLLSFYVDPSILAYENNFLKSSITAPTTNTTTP